MQNFADYYSTMLAKQLFKESRQQALDKNTTSDAEQNEADHIAAEHLQEDLLAYSIFYNPGCGHQSGQETTGQSKAFLKRWLSFYQPDAALLPQHQNLQQLDEHKLVLNKEHARLTAPLLATFLISVIMAALLMFRDSLLLLLIPVALLLLIWLRIRAEVKHSNGLIKNNRKWHRQQTDLLAQLTEQLRHINVLENVVVLQENYTRALEGFLHRNLHDVMPDLDNEQIREQLHAGDMQVFVLESPGILQIPDLCRQSQERLLKLGTLIRPGAETWCAEQPYTELEGLTRIHYVCAAMVLEKGVVLCHAYYDWVSDEMCAAAGDYFRWQNVTHSRLFETRFPAENVLSEDLSDQAYRAHFAAPVQVLAVSIRNGEQQCCTLPLRKPLRQTLLPNIPGTLLVRHLKRDAAGLNSLLSSRLQQHQLTGNRAEAGKVAPAGG
jgi:hypothetical protein